MATLNFDADDGRDDEEYQVIDVGNHGEMTCVCGYELIKADENIWKCTGGSHEYSLSNGDVMYDKFGNLLLRVPLRDGGGA